MQSPVANRDVTLQCQTEDTTSPPKSPVAFDIPCRSPAKAQVASAAKERLESYGERKSPEPKGPIADVPSAFRQRQPHSDKLEKAKDANAKKAEKAEKVKAEQQEAVEKKRQAIMEDLNEKLQRREAFLQSQSPKKQDKLMGFRDQESKEVLEKKEKLDKDLQQKEENRRKNCNEQLQKVQKHNDIVDTKKRCMIEQEEKALTEAKHKLEETHSQKWQKAEAQLSERKERACQHNEKVAERIRDAQQSSEQWKEEYKKQLHAGFAQKLEKADAQLTERKQKASQHNEKVAERVRDVQQQLEKRQEDIKAKLEQKKGSKVKGDLFSYVDKEVSGSPAGAKTMSCPAGLNAVMSSKTITCLAWIADSLVNMKIALVGS